MIPAPLIHRLRRTILFGALAVCLAVAGSAQWSVKQFDVRNGLPQSSVLDLAQDGMGFLWLTTEGGLVRFDGLNLRAVPLLPQRAPLNSRTRQIVSTLDHELIVDDAPGAQYFVHGHQVVSQLRTNGPRMRLRGGVRDLDAYLALLDSLTSVAGNALVNEAIDMLPMDDGALISIWRRTCTMRDATGRVSAFPVDAPAGPPFLTEQGAFYLSEGGKAYQFLADRGAVKEVPLRLPPGATEPFRIQQLFWKLHGERPYVLANDLIYAVNASTDGLRLDPLDLPLPSAIRIHVVQGLEDGEVIAVGTSSRGLLLFRKQHMHTFPVTGDGPTGTALYALADLGEGQVLGINNEHQALHFALNDMAGTLAMKEHLCLSGICLDRHGTLWGVRNGALFAYSVPDLHELDSLPVGAEWPVFLEEGPRLWVADQHRVGLVHEDSVEWRTDLGTKGNFDRPIVLRRLPDGRLAYGSSKGLFTWNEHRAEGFQSDPRFTGIDVRAIETIGGITFLGTNGDGVHLLDEHGRHHPLPLDPFKVLSHTHTFVPGPYGDLWMSTNQGVVRVMLSDVRRHLQDSTVMPRYSLFGAEDGMANPELNGGCDPAHLRLSDGRICFPSLEGLVCFDPAAIPDALPTHPLLIGKIVVDGRDWPIDQFAVYPPGTRMVEVEFAMAYYGAPVNAQLEYRIPSMMDAWAPLSRDQGRLLIERPPPGDHDLYIRPVGATSPIGEGEPFFEFRVRPYFFNSLAGYALIALVVLLLWLLFWRINTIRLRRRNRQLVAYAQQRTAEVDERNRQLTRALLNRETMMAILSHDILTPLRFIARVSRSSLSLVNDRARIAQLKGTLEDLTESAEKLQVNTSAALDWLKHNPDRITPDRQAQELRALVQHVFGHWSGMARGKGIHLINNVPEATILRTDPNLLQVILNNLVGNAIGHEINATELRIAHHREPDGDVLTISDNGSGMTAETVERLQALLISKDLEDAKRFARGDGHGIGYSIVAALGTMLGATLTLQSGPDGTMVRMRLPLDVSPGKH